MSTSHKGLRQRANLFLFQEPNVWSRRTDLHGAVLRDSTLSWTNINQITTNATEDCVVETTGLLPELLRLWAGKLNFTVESR